MQPVWLCILSGKQFEDTFEETQWRKVKQMQPVWLCILWSKFIAETFENPQWRKVEQMQPMRLCLFSGRQFEYTSENAQWGKVKQMQPVWLCLLWAKFFEETYDEAQISASVWKVTICHCKRTLWGLGQTLRVGIQIDEININSFTFRQKNTENQYTIDALA